MHNSILSSLIGPKGEPKITHGHTLVSELSLEEVAETINVRILNYIGILLAYVCIYVVTS